MTETRRVADEGQREYEEWEREDKARADWHNMLSRPRGAGAGS
jgi:hypothetical protein